MTKFKGFSLRDPTQTETARITWARKLKSIYRAYSRDAQAVIKTGPALQVFTAQIEGFSALTNYQGKILAQDLILESYKGGVYRADIISGSILEPVKATGPALGITSGVPGMIGPANQEAINLLTTRTFDGIKGMTAEFEKKIKFQMVDGMQQGKGMKAIAKDVAKVSKHELYKAERIVRTEYVNAHNQAAKERYEDYGFTHYSISVEDCEPECEICPPMRGQVFKFGSGPTPPFHPNCRCSIFPVER